MVLTTQYVLGMAGSLRTLITALKKCYYVKDAKNRNITKPLSLTERQRLAAIFNDLGLGAGRPCEC